MSQMEQTLGRMYEAVVRPVHSYLRRQGERRAAFVVAGALGLLPLHAASWWEDGQLHHLIEEIEIVYAPSAWVLRRCAERERRDWTPVLGIGNPESTQPLPFSEWEVEHIESLVEARTGKGAFNRLVGPRPTVENVAELLPAYSVAHLACHGEWNFQEPLQSALMLAGDSGLTLGRLLTQTRLEKARLVVLSACESGTGYRPGSTAEEYLGLPAGFIIAGAKSVIGSLWSVSDPPTALLMVRLYQNLLEGIGTAEALRQAQLWLRSLSRSEAIAQVGQAVDTVAVRMLEGLVVDYQTWLTELGEYPFAHPYYWAAFTAYGSAEQLIWCKGGAINGKEQS